MEVEFRKVDDQSFLPDSPSDKGVKAGRQALLNVER